MFRHSMKYFNASAVNIIKGQFSPHVAKPLAPWQCRNISTGMRRLNIGDNVNEGHGAVSPTPFQQRVLVWTKTFKTAEEVPKRITREKMARAMDKFRVKMCIYMTVGTILISATISILGRRRLSREQRNMSWQGQQEK